MGKSFLNECRDRAVGLADFLRYALLVDDGVMFCKGGEYLAGWYVRGLDLDSASAAERNYRTRLLNQELSRFGSGWMIHIDRVRRPTSGYPGVGAFPDVVSRLIDQERRLTFETQGGQWTTWYAIALTWLPPSLLEAKGKEWLYASGEKSDTGTLIAKELENFKQRIGDFERSLAGIYQTVDRLKTYAMTVDGAAGPQEVMVDGLSSWLTYCVTGEWQTIRAPQVTMYMDAVIGHQDAYTGTAPVIGTRHVKVLNIEGYPDESYPSMLDFLIRLPIEFRHSQRFIFMDAEDSKGVIDSYYKIWTQKIIPIRDQISGKLSGKINHHARDMAADAQQADKEAESRRVVYGNYTSVVVIMHEDVNVLNDVAETIQTQFKNHSYAVRVEDVNAFEAYLGSLPGEGRANVRDNFIHTANLSHLAPVTAIWTGPLQSPCKFYRNHPDPLFIGMTSGAAPFRYCSHVADVGHTAIFGPTGSGKSSLLNLMAAQQLRYPDGRIYWFGKDYGEFVTVKSLNGVHYDIGGEDADIGYAPFANIHRPSERRWATEWLESLILLAGGEVGPGVNKKLDDALVSLARTDNAHDRTMTYFCQIVQDEKIRAALERYTRASANGRMLDDDQDYFQHGRIQCFEMSHLMDAGEKAIVPVLTYLFHKIESAIDGTPFVIILDEGWLYLSVPVFEEKLRDFLLTIRKGNGQVWFATQNIDAVLNSRIAPTIIQSCPTKIYLPNPDATSETTVGLYQSLGLSMSQIELIASLRQQRDYFYSSPMGRRVFQLGLGPFAASFLLATGKEDYLRARDMVSTHGEGWTVEWLKSRGQNELAEILAREIGKNTILNVR